MKFFLIFAVILAVTACMINALPAPTDEEPEKPKILSRYKRFTCDVLSGLKVEHSACAIHCLMQFKKGGYCNDKAVCVCK
ncbi:defensin Lucifensin-like [Haematobia irritans]|uniref:defensin Lucifensin-like n=1 Tax=Haematobia irritans TaxID=7368 RepID=UPI003F4FE23E